VTFVGGRKKLGNSLPEICISSREIGISGREIPNSLEEIHISLFDLCISSDETPKPLVEAYFGVSVFVGTRLAMSVFSIRFAADRAAYVPL